MAQARKIDSKRKKYNLKTFRDAIEDTWSSCLQLTKHSQRVDCYLKETVKGLERQCRTTNELVRTSITHMNQPLPLSSEFD